MLTIISRIGTFLNIQSYLLFIECHLRFCRVLLVESRVEAKFGVILKVGAPITIVSLCFYR